MRYCRIPSPLEHAVQTRVKPNWCRGLGSAFLRENDENELRIYANLCESGYLSHGVNIRYITLLIYLLCTRIPFISTPLVGELSNQTTSKIDG